MYGKGGKDEMRAVTFGEIMLRLSPCGYKRLVQADCFEAVYGGAEANVAVSLAQFGCDSVYVTRLPQNDLAKACRVNLQKWGVDTSKIVFGGDRVGIYYMEKGISQRPSNVIYDRAGSAFAMSEANDYDFEKILDGADWFHFTGITPALSANAQEITLAAIAAAKRHKVTVSCDMNYRAKLWDKKKARQVLGSLLEQTDVCIANKHQVAELFGAPEEDAARYLSDRYAFSHIALSARRTLSATRNVVSGRLYSGGEYVSSREYDLEMAERVGGGDAFAAGIVYALGNGYPLQRAIDLAAACCCLKHTIPGDTCRFSLQEAETLAEGDGTCGIRR